jgi:3-oxoacyl-[acyl-carrier protein] reductase
VRIDHTTRAIVTGASRGIGRATAAALAARGARLGLIARDEAALGALAGELDGDHVVLAADVGDRDSIAGAIERFVEQAGGLELAIANAGLAHYGPFFGQPLEHAEEMVRVNVLGTFYTVRAALAHMLDRANGHVVVVSSGAGLRAFPWGAVYGATKAADRGFAEALRHELSGTGVSVTTVFPGEVATDLHSHQRDKLPDWRRDENTIAPEQVADAILEGVEHDRRQVHVPAAVRALGLNGIAPRLTDRLVAALRGPTAAPRRD